MATRPTFRERTKGLAVTRLALSLGFQPHSWDATKHFYFYGPNGDKSRFLFSIHWYKYTQDTPHFQVGQNGTSSETQAIAWLHELVGGAAPAQTTEGAVTK